MCDVLLTVEEVGRRHHRRDRRCHQEDLVASALVGPLVVALFRVGVVYSLNSN